MNDATIIYYTSNKENPEFEQRVRDNILEVSGGLPIISVSQKPIDFGTNICVGDDIGVTGFNVCRQSLIACEAATTKYVITAEADTFYPPEYFTFRPDKDDKCYRDTNLYVMGLRRNYFYRKTEGALHAQVINREFYIKRLKKLFEGAPQWSATEKNFPKERGMPLFEPNAFEYYQTINPVVQVKTSQAMRYHTHSERIPIHEIQYWGSGKDFRKKYYETN